ncbi:MAG: hypothetical protein LUD39_02520 [Opitutae bacterium]|nr:hypothetical protein [Opitutae bacterium]MCD8298620.1 hypothetical protein [Opitutae bacterium]
MTIKPESETKMAVHADCIGNLSSEKQKAVPHSLSKTGRRRMFSAGRGVISPATYRHAMAAYAHSLFSSIVISGAK